MRRLAFCGLVATSGACTDPIAKLGELVEVGTADSGGSSDDGSPPPPMQHIGTEPERGVDVLVVVDNTASMAEEQAAVSEAVSVIAQGLANLTDVRVAFTTTDHGNPACVGTTPEAGALRATSCRARIADFADDGQLGCMDVCGLESFATLPTTTATDDAPAPRPWIESIAGLPNVDVDFREAIACAAPQGTNGCGFEQPLEAMYSALQRSTMLGDPGAGFVRPDAALAIIVVTSAVDCSYQPSSQEIFLPDGSRVFWTDPAALAPTAAVCWNAGVTCSGGDADTWEACVSQDKDVTGAPAPSADTAALHPLSRYTDGLAQIIADKTHYLAEPSVALFVFAGVPSGYASGDTLSYPKSGDAQYFDDFGGGPGCGEGDARAVAPVRLRAFAEGMAEPDRGRVLSVCDLDYGTALQELAVVASPLGPLCVPECAADLDLESGGLQPSCAVTQERGSDGARITEEVPLCGGVPAAPVIPDGVNQCWYGRIDRVGSTPDPSDDVDQACIDAATNLQLQIVRREGFAAPGGTSIFAGCEPDPSCP